MSVDLVKLFCTAPLDKEVYTTDEAAQVLGVHRVTLRRYCQEGRIGFVKKGRDLRFLRTDLEQFIKTLYREVKANDNARTTDDPKGNPFSAT